LAVEILFAVIFIFICFRRKCEKENQSWHQRKQKMSATKKLMNETKEESRKEKHSNNCFNEIQIKQFLTDCFVLFCNL